MSRQSIFEEIISERKRQDVVFGEQNHLPIRWIPILAEEVGSAAKQANNFDRTGSEMSLRKYELETIQVAAVAFAMLECLEREKWRKKDEQSKKRSPKTQDEGVSER